MRERIYIFFWALCCLFFSGLYSQSPRKFTPQQIWESGLPFILNYEAKEYKSNPQNWCFLEGNNNFLYVGNTLGILEYDGVQWNTISLSNSSLVRSLAKTDEGKIYAGGVKEMGYLESDSIGRTRFQSLLPQLDSIYHDFTDVWNTRTLGNEVFFCTNQYLFKWDGTKFKVWKSKGKFGNMFEVHGNLYVPSKPEGILTLKNDELVPIPGGDFFNKTLGKVADMQPLHDGAILVSYSYTGLYKYENNQFTPILLYNSIH
jgi:hypothetical protein